MATEFAGSGMSVYQRALVYDHTVTVGMLHLDPALTLVPRSRQSANTCITSCSLDGCTTLPTLIDDILDTSSTKIPESSPGIGSGQDGSITEPACNGVRSDLQREKRPVERVA